MAGQTVRGEVAKREASQAPATVTQAQVIKQQLNVFAPVLRKLLPPHISVERFEATIGNACRNTEGLIACEPASIVAAALKAAQLGLEPNDSRNLCWILPYGGKASWQLGYGGVLEMARRAVPGMKTSGSPVFPNDEFDIDWGRDQPLIHRPAVARRMERGGEAYAWYVKLRYPDGDVQVFALDREGVEYHRKFSKQPRGKMWNDSYDAAALKSVVMDARRWIPQSTEFADAIALDERTLRIEGDELVADDEPERLGAIPHTPDTPTADNPPEKGEAIDATATESTPDNPLPGPGQEQMPLDQKGN